jgi:nucleotide-binding universal stress UspA family protein
MTHRHGTVDLLGPEDTVDIDIVDSDTADIDTADIDTVDIDTVDIDTVRIGPPRTRTAHPRVVAALRELPADGPVLAEAVAATRRLHGELVLLHAVPLSFAARSVGLDEAVHRGEGMLAAAAQWAAAAGTAPEEALLVRVRPHELVGERLEADLLVVGGPPADEPLRLGPVTRSAARHAPCTLLVVPRS